MDKMLTELSELLALLGKSLGIGFSWHFVDAGLCRCVRKAQTQHESPFCAGVKKESSRKNLCRCIREHHSVAFAKALAERRPFLLHCHAGAVELCVPVFAVENLLGVLFAGPYRDGSKKSRQCGSEEEYSRLPPFHGPQVQALGFFLDSLIRRMLSSGKIEETHEILPQTKTADTRVIRAILHMRRHAREHVEAAAAAAEAGLSVSRFLHVFSQETGFPFRDFMQRIRIENAIRLVEGSDLPFGSIAELCGIPSQSRMTLLFRRYLGRTPRILRKQAGRLAVGRGAD